MGTQDRRDEAGDGTRRTLSVIIDVREEQDGAARSVEAIAEIARSVDAEVIVAIERPWPDAPDGVRVVSFPSTGRGDRFDAAARTAAGEVLAFVDSQVTVPPTWAAEIQRLFEDPTLVVAGGPVVPEGGSRSERLSALVMAQYLRASPASHNTRLGPSRRVQEVGVRNLAIRADAFKSVGGFQTPAGANGEALRLCYKVRSLLDGTIRSEPGMAVRARAPRFTKALLGEVATYGRNRGGLARRISGAAPLFPYAVPSALFLGFCAGIVLTALPATRLIGVIALIAVFTPILAQSVRSVPRGAGFSFTDRILAAAVFPVVMFLYGARFLQGWLGRRNIEEVAPPRERRMPLRILIMNWRDVTHPHSGGAETYMHQIAKRWAASGLEVGWLTQRHAGASRQDVIDGVRIHRVGGKATQYPWAAFTYLVRLRHRYDVVVDCENGVPFFSPFYCRKPKVLVVHHVHQEIFRSQLPRQVRWLALWLEGWLMPRAYRHAELVAVSDGTRDDLIGIGFQPDRIRVVTNGVIPPKEVGGGPSEHPTILAMGRLAPHKSVDVLIRAMPAVMEHFPDLSVDIIGQGPDRARLERLAWSMNLPSRIRFHGYVASKVRDELASRAWVATCTSSFEGWGVVCMEASAGGIPVVASNVSGLRESVRDGETGLLFPYGDHLAMADALIRLLGDPEERARMGAAGRAWAAMHTWDRSAELFSALLETMTGRLPQGVERPPAAALAGRT